MATKLGIEVRLNTEVNAEVHAQRAAPVRRRAWSPPARASTASGYGRLEGAERLVDAIDVAHGRVQTGQRVVVIGGGKIGLVVAESLRKHDGAEVTIVEREKRIAGDVMPSFKWRHSAWVEELGIACLTSTRVVKVTARRRARCANAKGVETLHRGRHRHRRRPARRPNQALFHEFEWMVDELHGVRRRADAARARAAIQEGFRLGVRL